MEKREGADDGKIRSGRVEVQNGVTGRKERLHPDAERERAAERKATPSGHADAAPEKVAERMAIPGGHPDVRPGGVTVDNSGNGGILKTGGKGGALDPLSDRAQEHAEQYYESVRKMTTDCSRISENSGFALSDVQKIKRYVFEDVHDLGGEEPERFYPSFEMAESWQRLIDVKDILHHDLTLLSHELLELRLVAEGMTQVEAHLRASAEFDYATEVKEYYGQT